MTGTTHDDEDDDDDDDGAMDDSQDTRKDEATTPDDGTRTYLNTRRIKSKHQQPYKRIHISNKSQPSSKPGSLLSSKAPTWADILLHSEAGTPRVGSAVCQPDRDLWRAVQQLLPDIEIHSIYTCRGMNRFKVPDKPEDNAKHPLRTTISKLRDTGDVVIQKSGVNWFPWGEARRPQGCNPKNSP